MRSGIHLKHVAWFLCDDLHEMEGKDHMILKHEWNADRDAWAVNRLQSMIVRV